MNLNDIKISVRLPLGFACLVILVVLIAGFGFTKVKATNQSITTIDNDRVVPLKQLKTVHASMRRTSSTLPTGWHWV